MKVSLICTGGLSTNWLVARMEEYTKEHDEQVEVRAFGAADYYPDAADSDAVLLGPQISYYKKDVEAKLGCEVAVISSGDYATANIENILAQAKKLAGKG